MKKYRLCIALVILVGIISSCSVLPASNGPTATIETPIPTISYSHPTESPSASPSQPPKSPSASPSSPLQPTASADTFIFDEQKYFNFGMSRKKVEEELNKLNIEITDEGEGSGYFDQPDGFFTILTDNMRFEINDQDELYSIYVYNGETVKGLQVGDTEEKIQQLYGTPDGYRYIYNCNGYEFTVCTKDKTVSGWIVSKNIWNDLKSYKITNAMYASDDSIQFNEENFSNLFKFGISRKELKKKLIGLGIRIDLEEQYVDGWGIDTDHVNFSFDNKQHLVSVCVSGWGTAKLKIGDSIEKLHQSYGKEDRLIDNNVFRYYKQGYIFETLFNNLDSDDLGLSSWNISLE